MVAHIQLTSIRKTQQIAPENHESRNIATAAPMQSQHFGGRHSAGSASPFRCANGSLPYKSSSIRPENVRTPNQFFAGILNGDDERVAGAEAKVGEKFNSLFTC